MFAKCLSALVLCVAGAVALGDEVTLTSGEVLKVANVKTAEGRVEMDHPILGHLSVPATEVTSIKGADGMSIAGAAGILAEPPGPPAPPPPPPPEAPAWKTKAEVGINGTSGNTRSTDLRLALGTKLETETERWVFNGVYLKSRTEGVTTVNNWFVMGLHDWLYKDSPWLVFVTGRYDWDKFQDYDKRVQVGAGAGYKLFDDEKLKLRLRAGFNETREYGAEDDSWRPEGLLGAEGSYKINESQELTAALICYPDLDDTGEYRVVAQAGWSIKLNEHGLSMMLGATDEIDSHREDPEKKANLKYFLALIYEF